LTHEEFVSWLSDEVNNERMTTAERDDLLDQKQLFENNRSTIESEYDRRIVGYVAGLQLISETIHELIDSAKGKYPNKMIYFEPIGFAIL
jgi:hypothetical protein